MMSGQTAEELAQRMTSLYYDALDEDDMIHPESLLQCKQFFLTHSKLGRPKVTLTPDSLLRVRWIHGPDDFVAIEFLGGQVVKLVVEMSKNNGLTIRHFSTENIQDVLSVAYDMGAYFANIRESDLEHLPG